MTSGDDERLVYSPAEKEALTERLRALTAAVATGATRGRPLDLSLLQQFHGDLFDGVRSFAGKVRSRDFGSEHLTFGPHRSCHRTDVAARLAVVFQMVERRTRQLGAEPSDEDYDLNAIGVAVFAHAEIVRIHPFEDGNGRTSRLCASHLLVTFGLRPVAIEAVKQEYTDALNHFFLEHELRPLVDLYVALSLPGRRA